ncbi:MAG: hypothetical protein M1825_000958 [Sarcosagium campestre]|nr:MAG: hypothetical protein M1825_000958 [Sarcosagium campestre]
MAQQAHAALPTNLNQQEVKQMYTKYMQLKEQGVGANNPEYARLHSILTQVQQRSHQRQQQLLNNAGQSQHQRQQQPKVEAQAIDKNGINGHAGSAVTHTNVGPASGLKQSVNAPTSQASAKPAAASSAAFTGDQLLLLRNQILAFKHLTKHMAIPPKVQQIIFSGQKGKHSSPISQGVTSAGQTSGQVNDPSSTSAQPELSSKVEPTKQRNAYESFTSPYDSLKRSISYVDHASRDRRIIIPSIFPPGVDADQLRTARERAIYNRVTSRKRELSKLPSNLASWDTSKSSSPNADDSLKLKVLLEYKMLQLLPKQRLLRQRFSQEMISHDNLAMTANRAQYRRMKKQSLREARITEKLEKQQRDAKEGREKALNQSRIEAAIKRSQALQVEAASEIARKQKLGRMMMVHHQHIEKEEQKRVERTAKQRLQALKSNDEEAYLKLLDQAKDTRITHLLKQTDGFLKQLAASVKQQQRDAAELYGDKGYEDAMDAEDDEDEDEDVEDNAKVDYYQVAHRIKEEVKEQPNLLVGGTLKEYQIKGLQWMISLYNNNLNGILADEMGLGKTIQTISLITYLVEKKRQNGPFLVIVPLSTLTNWNVEFEKWAPQIRRIVYKGPPAARKLQQQQLRGSQFQVLLTTYEFIIKDRPVLSKVRWVHMIVDEGHRMKNAQSKLSNTLTQYYTTRYRLILTGTPLQNNLPELWALLNFVLPTIFKSVKSFDEWFNTPFANTGGQDKMELTEEEQLLVIRRLHKVLRPFLLRRLKKDVEKDLPEKSERVVKCRFSALQAKLYKQMMTDQKIMVGDGKGGKTGIRGLSNMLMQLRKLCNHPYVFQEVEDQINPSRSIDDSIWRTAGKFELLDRVLPKFKASGHRVLMFFQMTNIMNIMEDYMRLRSMQYLRLDGTTKSDDRSDLLKAFNAPDSPYFCFLLSTRAGGLGLNLQTADTVIIFDSDWNPHQDLQAQDRAHRIGQKNEVRILRLISANSVEEKILERAQYKLDMDGKVIQAGKFDNKSTNEEREQLLRTLMESAEATETIEQEEMDDDDLNLIMSRSDDELELFKKMDEERERDSPYGPNKDLPRLWSEAELPDIYLAENNPVVEEIEEYAGRGARQRTQVKYDDGLTEEQWAEAVDADDDTIEEAVARKQARLAKRQANKEKREGGGDAGDASSPAASRASSEPALPKKRGRKPKSEKRKAEEAALDDVQPPAKRKRNKLKSSTSAPVLNAEERALHQRIFNNVFDSLSRLEPTSESEEDDDGEKMDKRKIITPFVALPSKKLYPDYYVVIKQPIAMNEIKKRIQREDYSSLKEFLDDVRTLCTNAKTYNEDTSLLFQDAQTIEMECLARLREETRDHPELADFEEATPSVPPTADGRSTAPISGAATPVAPSGLKLTFKNANLANGGGSNGGQNDDDDDLD